MFLNYIYKYLCVLRISARDFRSNVLVLRVYRLGPTNNSSSVKGLLSLVVIPRATVATRLFLAIAASSDALQTREQKLQP